MQFQVPWSNPAQDGTCSGEIRLSNGSDGRLNRIWRSNTISFASMLIYTYESLVTSIRLCRPRDTDRAELRAELSGLTSAVACSSVLFYVLLFQLTEQNGPPRKVTASRLSAICGLHGMALTACLLQSKVHQGTEGPINGYSTKAKGDERDTTLILRQSVHRNSTLSTACAICRLVFFIYRRPKQSVLGVQVRLQ